MTVEEDKRKVQVLERREASTYGLSPMAAIVPRTTRKALGGKGLAFGTLALDWVEIAGPDLGARTLPEKLAFPKGQRRDATLTVRAGSSAALEVQHMQTVLLERINTHFGYSAVARIKIIQAPLPAPKRSAIRRKPVGPARLEGIAAAVASIEDETLRESLRRLGEAIAAERG
jgi:hypothetical protein